MREQMDMKLTATLRPSALSNKLAKGRQDNSVSSHAHALATRWVLGKRIVFYRSGEHVIQGQHGLTDEEQYNSELLRFVHASLLASQPIGDEQVLYVDASQDPVEVYICGLPGDEYMRQVREAIATGDVPAEMVADRDDQTISLIKKVPKWRI